MRRLLAFFSAAMAALFFLSALQAQRRLGPDLHDTLGQDVSQEEGWKILEEFRSLTLGGDFRFRFNLEIMPRRGESRTLPGLMLGSLNEQGPITRFDVVVKPAELVEGGPSTEPETLRFLVQNGPAAYAIRSAEGGGPPQLVEGEERFTGIADSDASIFDLLAPFVYWPDFKYEGRTKHLSRPTHLFWMTPPEEDEAAKRYLTGVRLYIDDQFSAMLQARTYDENGDLWKTITILDIKKADGEWIFGRMDVRDERTRSKTRFKIVDADLGLALPRRYFEPQSLVSAIYGKPISYEEEADIQKLEAPSEATDP